MNAYSCPSREEIQLFDSGRLADERWQDVADHLEACPACQQLLAELNSARHAPALEQFTNEPECQKAIDRVLDIPQLMEDFLPERVGRYRILARLGRGGMGTAFKAHDPDLDRICVIKVLRPSQALNPVGIERFRREWQTLAKLNHPAIVKAFDAGSFADGTYLAMEYIAGRTWQQLVDADGPLTPVRALQLIRDLVLAVNAIHAAQLIHRDIKPSNVMLDESDQVKLLDFGVAARSDTSDVSRGAGTLPFMAPEQFELGAPVDHRADYYAIGATLRFLITGESPGKPSTQNAHPSSSTSPAAQPTPAEADGGATSASHPPARERPRQRDSTYVYRPLDLAHPLLTPPLVSLLRQLLAPVTDDRPADGSQLLQALDQCLATSRQSPLHRLLFPAAQPWLSVRNVVLSLIVLVSTWAGLLTVIDPPGNRSRQQSQLAALPRSARPAGDSIGESAGGIGAAQSPPNALERLQDQLPWPGEASPRPALPGLVDRPAARNHRWQVTSVYPAQGFLHLGWSQARQRLAALGTDGIVRVYRIEDLSLQLTHVIPQANHSEMQHETLEWTRDGSYLAIAGSRDVAQVWSADRDVAQQHPAVIGPSIPHMVWNPAETELAALQLNGEIVFTSREGERLRSLQVHSQRPSRLCWPEPQLIYSADEGGQLFRTDLKAQKSVLLADFQVPVRVVTSHPQAQMLAVGTVDGQLVVLDPQGTVLHRHQCAGAISAVAWSPDGKCLAVGAQKAYVWRLLSAAPQMLATGPLSSRRVNDLVWMDDGQTVLLALDGHLGRWNITTDQRDLLHETSNRRVYQVAWSPDGERLAASAGDGTIYLISRSGTPLLTMRPPNPTPQLFVSLSWHPDGKLLVSGDEGPGDLVRVWDTTTGQQLKLLIHGHPVYGLGWSPDGSKLITGDGSGTLRLWDSRDFHLLSAHSISDRMIESLDWSAATGALAVSLADQQVVIWQVNADNTLTEQHRWTNQPDSIRSLRWSPDGQQLAIAGHLKTLNLVRPATGERIWGVDPIMYDRPTLVAWHPQGTQLACGNVGVLDAATGQFVSKTADFFAPSWHPEGLLAMGSWRGFVRVSRLPDQQQLWKAVLVGNEPVTFSPEGRVFAPQPAALRDFVYLREVGVGQVEFLSATEYFRQALSDAKQPADKLAE